MLKDLVRRWTEGAETAREVGAYDVANTLDECAAELADAIDPGRVETVIP